MPEYKWPNANQIRQILQTFKDAWDELTDSVTPAEAFEAWTTPGLKGSLYQVYLFSGFKNLSHAYSALTGTPTFDPTTARYEESYFMMNTGIWQSTAYELDGYQLMQPAGIMTVPLEKLVCAIAPMAGFSIDNEAFFHTPEWYQLRDACVQYLWDRTDVAPVLVTNAYKAYADTRLVSAIKQQLYNFSGQMENGYFFFPGSSYLSQMYPGERYRFITNEIYYKFKNPLGTTTYYLMRTSEPVAVFSMSYMGIDLPVRQYGIGIVSNRNFSAKRMHSYSPITQWDESLASNISFTLTSGTYGTYAGLTGATPSPGGYEILSSNVPNFDSDSERPSGMFPVEDASSWIANCLTADVDGISPWGGNQYVPTNDVYVFNSPTGTDPYTQIYIDPSTDFTTWSPNEQPEPVTTTPFDNVVPYTPTYQTPLPTTIPDPSPQVGPEPYNPSEGVDPDLIDWYKNYDDTVIAPSSEPPTAPTEIYPLPSGYTGTSGTSGMIHVYRPSPTAFNDFAAWLWVKWSDPVSVPRFWNNPIDGIISAHELYWGGHASGSEFIRSGFLESTVSAPVVDARYDTLDCGAVDVPEYYGNYMDYSPYVKVSAYLPFVGIVELNPDDIIGSQVHIIYNTDAYTGACLAQILCTKGGVTQKLYEFNGNCAVTIPLSGGTQSQIVIGLLNAGTQVINGVAQLLSPSAGGKNIASSIAGAIGDVTGAASTALSSKSSVQHSGTFSSNYGAMGSKKPYLIIRRPVLVNATNFNLEYGYPAHKRVIIGACAGYLRVREVNVVSATATDEEKQEIESLLKAGVYVS